MAISLPIVSKFDDKGVNGAEKAIGKLQGTLKTFAGIAIAAFSVDAIVGFGQAALRAAEDAEVANNRLENIAKTIGIFGDESGKVTKRIQKFAETLALQTGQSDESIKALQGTLLTFKGLAASADVAGGAFDRATVAAMDLAAAGLGSTEQAAKALGKILENPIENLGALGRAGVKFTDEQQAFIQALVDSNKLLEAQDYILGIIEGRVGGTAEATATATGKMKQAFGEIQEQIGTLLLPAFQTFATWLVENMPKIQEIINNVATGFQAFGQFIDTYFIAPFRIFAEETAPVFVAAWENNIKPAIDAMKPVFEVLAGVFMEVLKWSIDQVIAALEGFAEWLADPDNKTQIMIMTAILGGLAASFFAPVIAITVLIGVLGFLLDKFFEFVEWTRTNEWTRAIGAIVMPLQGLMDFIDRIIRGIQALQHLMRTGDWGAAERVAQNGYKGSGYAKQAKGGVTAVPGMSWVGEKGPELLSMPKGATVTPIPQHMRAEAMMGANTGGGVGNTFAITVNAGMGADGTSIGEEIVKQIKRYERSSGPVFARA